MFLGNRAVRHIADKADACCNTDARAQLIFRGGKAATACTIARLLRTARRSASSFSRVRIAEIIPRRRRHGVARQSHRSRQRRLGDAAPVASDDGNGSLRDRALRRAQSILPDRKHPVSCRRSIGREGRAADDTAGESTPNLVPQSPANLLRAGFAAPQARQRSTSAAPHCPQNFLCSGTSAVQFVQCIRTSTDINNPTTMRQEWSDPCGS